MTSPFNDHLGERAELYALGVLDADEAERVNAHAADCVACARLVGSAERAVMLLDAASVPDVAPPPELGTRIAASARCAEPARRNAMLPQSVLRWGALAAGLLLVLGGVTGTRSVLHMHEVVAQDDAALRIIANAHFKHATLTKLDPHAPTSKVLWGLTNRWIYVIVDSPACGCSVIAVTDEGERELGVPLGRGATAVLFANDLAPVRRVELRRAGATVETAALR